MHVDQTGKFRMKNSQPFVRWLWQKVSAECRSLNAILPRYQEKNLRTYRLFFWSVVKTFLNWKQKIKKNSLSAKFYLIGVEIRKILLNDTKMNKSEILYLLGNCKPFTVKQKLVSFVYFDKIFSVMFGQEIKVILVSVCFIFHLWF